MHSQQLQQSHINTLLTNLIEGSLSAQITLSIKIIIKWPIKPYKLRANMSLKVTFLSAASNTDFMYKGKNKKSAVTMPGL